MNTLPVDPLPGWAEIQAGITSTALILPRLTVVFLVVPFLAGRGLTGTVRSALLLMLAIFLSPLAGALPPSPSIGMLMLVAVKEAFIGLLLGLSFGVVFWVVQSVGDLVDFQAGAGNEAFFNPAAGHASGPTGEFLGWLVLALLVAGGGLLLLVGAIIDSYRVWPVTSFVPRLDRVLVDWALRQGDTLLTWIVKLAAPVVLVLLLVELGLGLVGRVAPQLNVFVVAQPLKSLAAVLMLLLMLGLIHESLQQLLDPARGLLALLRRAL